MINKKRRLPRDLLIASDHAKFNIVELILLAGIKNPKTQTYMRGSHARWVDPHKRTAAALGRWVMDAVRHAPASSTDFAYCTGQTYFTQSQLKLASVDPSSKVVTKESPRRVEHRSVRRLQELIDSCDRIFPGESRLPVPRTGPEYVQLARRLGNAIKISLARAGDYTTPRIARAVLCCVPTVTEGWDRVTCWQIHGISADQNNCFLRFVVAHGTDHTAADYARLMGCDRPELITMWHCLEK